MTRGLAGGMHGLCASGPASIPEALTRYPPSFPPVDGHYADASYRCTSDSTRLGRRHKRCAAPLARSLMRPSHTVRAGASPEKSWEGVRPYSS